jgi:hypothetical protein
MSENTKTKSASPIYSVADALLDSNLIAQTNTIKYNMKLIKCNGFVQIYKYLKIRIKKKILILCMCTRVPKTWCCTLSFTYEFNNK